MCSLPGPLMSSGNTNPSSAAPSVVRSGRLWSVRSIPRKQMSVTMVFVCGELVREIIKKLFRASIQWSGDFRRKGLLVENKPWLRQRGGNLPTTWSSVPLEFSRCRREDGRRPIWQAWSWGLLSRRSGRGSYLRTFSVRFPASALAAPTSVPTLGGGVHPTTLRILRRTSRHLREENDLEWWIRP